MRVDDLDPAGMTVEQRAIYDLFTTGQRAAPGSGFSLVRTDGRLQGPPAVWILSPPFGHALEQIGGAIRFGSRLPARAREIAVLLVGHHHRSPFELHAHGLAATAAGLSDDDQAAIAHGHPPTSPSDLALAAVQRAVFDATREMLRTGTLSAHAYDEAVAALTAPGLFELVTIIGYYSMLALQLAVFDVRPEAMP